MDARAGAVDQPLGNGPQPRRLVPRAGGQGAAIGAEGNRKHRTLVAAEGGDLAARRHLPQASTGRMLFSQNRSLLALRNASVNILQVTPKLVDAVFGKLPGALAEVAAKLGISFLEDRRRLVIYDFHEFMFQEVLFRNLMRMLKATEATEPVQGG